MNMCRIRHILEMRRQCKAPPLLPKKVRSNQDSKKAGVKEIIDIHIKLRGLRTGVGTSDCINCVVYESEGGRNGPWKMCTSSEALDKVPDTQVEDLFSVEFQFERPQAFRIDVCDWTGEDAIPLGYTTFLISEVVNSLGGYLAQRVISERTGECISLIDISCSLRPHAQPIMLQFEAREISKKVIPENVSVFFQVFRIEDNNERSLIYKSETIKPNEKMRWRQFTLQGNDVNDTPDRDLEVVCYFREDKLRRGTVGTFVTSYKMLKAGFSKHQMMNESYKMGRKSCGVFDVLRCTHLTIFSFLDYITFGVNVHLAFAVDFSLPETTSPTRPKHFFLDDVEMGMRSLGECFKDYNCTGRYAAFGFGARIPPHYRDSHEFCLNLETEPTCNGIDGVVDTLRNTYTRVQPLSSAHFAHVIYYVSKIAQNAVIRGYNSNKPSYYVLAIFTRGAIDDLKEAVQAVIFASRAPISIIFLGVEDGNLSEVERLGSAGKKLAFQGRKTDRDLLQYANISACRELDKESDICYSLCERALCNIPWQMSTFFMRGGVLPVAAKGEAEDIDLRQQLRAMHGSGMSTEDYGDEDDTLADDLPSRYSPRPPSSGGLRAPPVASNSLRESPGRRRRTLSTDVRSMSMHCGNNYPRSPRLGQLRQPYN